MLHFLPWRHTVHFYCGTSCHFQFIGFCLIKWLGLNFILLLWQALGPGVAYWLRHCATRRTVPGSIADGVSGNFFRGFSRENHVSWGRLSLWRWVPGISPGVKGIGAYGWRPTILVVPNVKNIRVLNYPEPLGPHRPFAGWHLTLHWEALGY